MGFQLQASTCYSQSSLTLSEVHIPVIPKSQQPVNIYTHIPGGGLGEEKDRENL